MKVVCFPTDFVNDLCLTRGYKALKFLYIFGKASTTVMINRGIIESSREKIMS